MSAQLTGIALVVRSAEQLEALAGAFVSMQQGRVQALIVSLSPFANEYRAQIAELAVQHRQPPILETRAFVDAGGLMSYGPNILDIFRRAAPYVDKIFKGARPADLPVELPTKFELAINMNTAAALGLAIPQSLLVQAEEVIR